MRLTLIPLIVMLMASCSRSDAKIDVQKHVSIIIDGDINDSKFVGTVVVTRLTADHEMVLIPTNVDLFVSDGHWDGVFQSFDIVYSPLWLDETFHVKLGVNPSATIEDMSVNLPIIFSNDSRSYLSAKYKPQRIQQVDTGKADPISGQP